MIHHYKSITAMRIGLKPDSMAQKNEKPHTKHWQGSGFDARPQVSSRDKRDETIKAYRHV
jgi:hypothetical protein